MASNGNAYVVSPDTESDIMVRSPNLMHALHGDRVRVSLFARRGGKRLEGEIVEIVERKQTDFVGTIEIGKSYGFLVPSSRKMLIDIYIPKDKPWWRGARSKGHCPHYGLARESELALW